ncbi:MAG: PhoU domain-containing protein [Actinomycetota bacterium]|nr:PhoU domain-containing protein [Actinomycetota bacterium]
MIDKGEQEDMEIFIRIIMASRFLERIADHAVDISEEVRYMVKKEFA